jgi:hypothetical protein
MSTRTTSKTITFQNTFTLSNLDGIQPPGTYRVVTDEEELSGESFVGFRRIATTLRLPAIAAASSSFELFQVDPEELAAALASDQQNKA